MTSDAQVVYGSSLESAVLSGRSTITTSPRSLVSYMYPTVMTWTSLTAVSNPTPTITPPAPTSLLPAQDAGLLEGWLGTALIPALVAAAVALTINAAKGRRDEQARVRTSLAEAYQAVADYKEFAYAIRRRAADAPAAERVRISEALRGVQSRLSYHQTWTRVEDETLGQKYNELVRHARDVVGDAMRRAWNEPPINSDSGMNIGRDLVDLSPLVTHEEDFLRTSRAHVEHVGRGALRRVLHHWLNRLALARLRSPAATTDESTR